MVRADPSAATYPDAVASSWSLRSCERTLRGTRRGSLERRRAILIGRDEHHPLRAKFIASRDEGAE